MRKSLLRLLLEFVAITAPLAWLWVEWGEAHYLEFLRVTAMPLLAGIGVEEIPNSPALKRFVNYVPFLGLMVITPGLGLRRRVLGVVFGFVLIFVCHIALVATEFIAYSGERPTEDAFSTLFPVAMLADALPFALWALIANDFLRDLFSRAARPASTGKD